MDLREIRGFGGLTDGSSFGVWKVTSARPIERLPGGPISVHIGCYPAMDGSGQEDGMGATATCLPLRSEARCRLPGTNPPKLPRTPSVGSNPTSVVTDSRIAFRIRTEPNTLNLKAILPGIRRRCEFFS